MKTPLTYMGGKQRMLKHILPLIPPHETYTESFAGGATLYWARQPAKVEVLNDINGELVNFYVVLKTKPDELHQKMQTLLHSRQQFDFARIVYDYPQFFDPVTRAWALWAQTMLGFASKLENSFGYNRTSVKMVRKIAYTKEALTTSLAKLAKRLQWTQIENTCALRVIQSRDHEEAFHFVDPPYLGTNNRHYGNTFSEGDFHQLLELLSRIKGKFMLTHYPHKLIDEYTQKHGWSIIETEKSISAQLGVRTRKTELIVINYNIESQQTNNL